MKSKARVKRVAVLMELYELLPERSDGGVVHVVTHDPNFEQASADRCIGECNPESELYSADMAVACAVADLTEKERQDLYERRWKHPA